MLTLRKILDADLEDLQEIHMSRVERFSSIGFYASVLRHYLADERELLERCIDRLLKAKFPEHDCLTLLAQARLEVRRGTVTRERIQELASLALPEGWEGECFYVQALSYEALEDTKNMSLFYLRASEELHKIGAEKKSVKALLNHVAAECRLDPDKKPIPHFEYVYRRAKKAKAFSTAAVCLLNISREYQTLGALTLALSYIQRAVTLLDRQKQTRSYFLAIAHRAHVLFDLGRVEDAKLDYLMLKSCTYHDLSGIRSVLDKIFQGVEPSVLAIAPPSWQGRGVEFLSSREKLGELEQKIIRFLAEEPKTKAEVIDYLYGDKIDWTVLEKRFFSAMTRLKKKMPGAIVFRRNRYELSEEVFRLCLRPGA
jgi:hypothetical protein